MKEVKYNQEDILDLKDKFQKSNLASRIVCLIVHGSSLFNPFDESYPYSDIDLELILEKPQADDYETIKKILDQSEKNIECQLRYLDEIKLEKNLVSLSDYKVFMYFNYANGICLIGKNVYQNLVKKISKEKIKRSLLISIQIYFKDIRKSFFRGDSACVVNKNINRTLLDICLAQGFLDYRQLSKRMFFKEEKTAFVDLILKNYSSYLNKEDIQILKEFIKKYQEKKIFPKVFPVIEKIVKIFEKNIQDT